MDPESFYAIVDDRLIGLEMLTELPESFLRAIPAHLDAILDTPAMTIGGWEDSSDGPLILALSSEGQLVSVVAANTAHLDSLSETLVSIDTWLAGMRLRDLSELSGNHNDFYEGLWDLSPDASITLSPIRRYVLLTAVDSLNINTWASQLPGAQFSVQYLDVLQAPGGSAIVRQRLGPVERTTSTIIEPSEADEIGIDDVAEKVAVDTHSVRPIESFSVAPEPSLEIPSIEHAAAEEPAANTVAIDFAPVDIPRVELAPAVDVPDDIAPLQLDQAEELVDEVPAVLDNGSPADDAETHDGVIVLTSNALESNIDINLSEDGPPHIEPGLTYDLDQLPLLFDKTGANLESISDELFAIDTDIVLVVKLPERRRYSPFEDRHRFRWDTRFDQLQLLNEHSFNAKGIRRTIHLFVESLRQPEYATYIGELSRVSVQPDSGDDTDTAWFSIEPRVEPELLRMLKKGRLPQHVG